MCFIVESPGSWHPIVTVRLSLNLVEGVGGGQGKSNFGCNDFEISCRSLFGKWMRLLCLAPLELTYTGIWLL